MKTLRTRKKEINTELYFYRYMMFSILGFCILFCWWLYMKPLRKNYNIVFLDIDGTIVDSNHRQNAFGKPNALSLDYWLKNTTRENIFKG